MKTAFKRSILSALFCFVLIAVIVLPANACRKNTDNPPNQAATPGLANSPASDSGVTELGEGQKSFSFEVVLADGTIKKYLIHTDETTVGAALLALELIAGDDGDYGLYVKTVDGVTADYDTDGTYWAFYINDEYASTGVDTTDIVENGSYAFKIEK